MKAASRDTKPRALPEPRGSSPYLLHIDYGRVLHRFRPQSVISSLRSSLLWNRRASRRRTPGFADPRLFCRRLVALHLGPMADPCRLPSISLRNRLERGMPRRKVGAAGMADCTYYRRMRDAGGRARAQLGRSIGTRASGEIPRARASCGDSRIAGADRLERGSRALSAGDTRFSDLVAG